MKSIAYKYGFYMFLGFTAFFLFMKLFNLNFNLNLRIFNGIIHISLIYMAILAFSRRSPQSFNYLSGVAAGMWTSFVGVLLFALFQLIYLSIDTPFMEYIRANAAVGEYLTPFTASLVIFMEGLMVSLLGSYLCMRIIDMRIAPTH